MKSDSSISDDEKCIQVENVQYVKSAAEKKLVRKLNNNVLPLVFFIIFVQVKVETLVE